MSAKSINKEDFNQEVLESDKYVLVDFWAEWCGPCVAMAPVLDKLSQDESLKDKISIVKVNIEEGENRDLAAEYSVMSIPNMKVFKDGKIVKEIVGLKPEDMMKKELVELVE